MFTLAPAKLIKGPGAFPEFAQAMKDIEGAAIARALDIWKGYELGGLTPGKKQFGICPFLPAECAQQTSARGSATFRKSYTGTGWKPIMDYSVPEDEIHAFAGFAITDEALRFNTFRMEIGDRKFPKWDIQEAQGWDGGMAIILKENKGDEIIAVEETDVDLRGWLESAGYQRVVPLGFMLYKRLDIVIKELEQ